MPNLNAALGSAQIENLNKFLKSKRKLFLRYTHELEKIRDIILIKNPQFSKSNNWLNTIFIKNSSIKKRNRFLKLAHKNKIYLRPVWRPLHLLKHFNNNPRMNLSNALIIYKSCINLPSSASYFIREI
jgi:dTDP-4-amino-4,6-dideoxygalactose transaminase